MAAYAAVVSLMNLMEQIQNHPRHSISLDKKQIESLRKKVSFLQDFLEGYNPHGGSKEAEDLESQIAYAAHATEDVIESHVVNQILAGSKENSSISLLDLRKAIQNMDSIKEKVMKVKEERGFKDQQLTNSVAATSSTPLTTGKSTMVGFDDYSIQLMDMLTGQRSSREIITIAGMGGIGKTTLARNVYENLLIMQHFDNRIWVTVSQEYNVREILLELLSCERKSTGESNEELGERLHKSLSGRRYLIVLDDMWSIEAWEKIKFFFPDNNKRSRIVVTTRISNMAIHFGSSCITVDFLDEDRSWNLFCKKAFEQESCPDELEGIGKMIVKKCQGLPLSIVVLGGLLRTSPRTRDCWWNVAEDIVSIWNSGEYEYCLKILFLSYIHLSAHLKPCFLYVGTFHEDHEIRASRLIKLWVAEGFLKQNKTQSLEETAEGYLKDLIDRNLIMVGEWGSNGKIKTCNIHDLLRDLCLRIAEKENFFCVMKGFDHVPQCLDRERRIIFHEGFLMKHHQRRVLDTLQSQSLVRSLICNGGNASFKFRLLRVLNVVDDDSLEAIFGQVNLRYVAYESLSLLKPMLPSSISLLWNVQTIIIRIPSGEIVEAPSEIWHMPQLRHLEIHLCFLPNPSLSYQQDDFDLPNLQKLSNIVNFKWSEKACKRIRNVKKLLMRYYNTLEERDIRNLEYIGHLHKLESLNCYFYYSPSRSDLLQNLTLPSSLKKLVLQNFSLHWADLTMIGSLPHLEVLKLESFAVRGSTWNPVEGEFLRLKFLKIYLTDLIYWIANSSHFPVLENLVLANLLYLNEIPLGIGEIPTLRLIHLRYCTEFAAISSMRILEEQESLGNEGLQVRVRFFDVDELESCREKMELESLTCKNFHLYI